MEQQAVNALERIENPILILLLVALMTACVALWFALRAALKQQLEILPEYIPAVTNTNAVLQNMAQRLDDIEEAVSSQGK